MACRIAVIFLYAISIGLIVPLLPFINDLTHPVQTAFLLVVFFVGRLIGDRFLPSVGRSISRRRLLALSLLATAGAYLLLALAMRSEWRSNRLAFGCIYLALLLAGLTSAILPQPIAIAQPDDLDATLGLPPRLTAILFYSGIGIGSLFTWILYRRAPLESFLEPGGIICRTACAVAVIDLLAAIFAITCIARNSPRILHKSPAAAADRRFLIFIFFATAPFAMVGPLFGPMHWESFQATPADFARVVGVLALTHAAVQMMASQPSLTHLESRLGMLMGLGVSLVGILGLDLGVRISWMTRMLDAEKIALTIVWIAGLLIAVGHALILSACNAHMALRQNNSQYSPKPPTAFSADPVAALACTVMPMISAAIWCRHERTSFSVPGLILLAALIGWTFAASSTPKPDAFVAMG